MASSLQNDDAIQINVRIQGENKLVQVAPGWNIKQLKTCLAESFSLPQGQFRIIFAGSVLPDSLTLQECQLGQHSVVHVLVSVDENRPATINESKPASLAFLRQTTDGSKEADSKKKAPRFYVYCKLVCHELKPGKLRVRCRKCKDEAFTLSRGPDSWHDVLQRDRISGQCINRDCHCNNAEFFFKCAGHASLGNERDLAIPLRHVTSNTRDVHCLACLEILDTVLLFPCEEKHAICIPCFSTYCQSKITDRQFTLVPDIGYTVSCPGSSDGCRAAFIQEIHHFRLAGDNKYDQYQRFATEDLVLQSGGILCPGRGCGNGITLEDDVRKVICKRSAGGCGLVFCRECLREYHRGECRSRETETLESHSNFEQWMENARLARWEDEENLKIIRQTTKQCPGCHSPTEKAGGCNHMTCQRCQFQWCWNCLIEWNSNCQGDHWFRIL
eukprot:gene366-999_t